MKILFFFALQAAGPQGGDLISVPGAWEANPKYAEHDGFAWYRCYIKVPDRWATRGGRDLWAESVVVGVGRVADAYEVYVNGTKIGSAGAFPPNFARAPDGLHRHKVPPGLLAQGAWNVLAIRVYNQQGKGGFLGRAPFLAGYYEECILEGAWEFRTGDDLAWAEAARAEKPSRAAFDTFVEATTPLDEPAVFHGGPSLPPEEACKALRVAEDLQVEQVLSEPVIAQPLQLSFDERGRLWVVEYRQYPFPAGIKVVSRDKFYRAVYDKVPPPPPRHVRGRDRISIHEDSDGDGTFDRHTVFADGLNMATAVARGRGGVWVLNPPYLLFYPDRNEDDRPDGDPVVHLEGFGLEDTHAVANSLTWGPDGWLYGAQGSTVSSRVSRPGVAAEPVYVEGPAVWRYHPETRRYEIFAEGGGNAFGIEIDAQGRLYSGYNGGNTRGFHYLQGAYYTKGTEGKYGPLSNPFAFGHLSWMIHASPAPRFTHTFVKYEAEALPERYRGGLFCVDPLQRNLVFAALEPDGSTFKTRDVSIPLASGDPAFRPVDIKVGPDGALYIADFYEYYIAHGQHYQGQLDPGTGRVYRLRRRGAAPPKPFDLRAKTSAELVEHLLNPEKWHRQTALRILADRRDRSVLPRLTGLLDQRQDQGALEAFWAIYRIGGLDEAIHRKALSHANPYVRLWAVRLAGDEGRLGSEVAALADRETHPEVRAQLACTAKRLPGEEGLAVVRGLLNRTGDARDPHLPLLVWWAVESKCETHREGVLALLDRPVPEPLLERVMRRFAQAETQVDWAACEVLLRKAFDASRRAALMRGLELAFQGRAVGTLPEGLARAIAEAGGGSIELRVRAGDASALEKALATLEDRRAAAAARLRIAQLFGEIRVPGAVAPLLGIASAAEEDPALRSAALAALRLYDESSIAEKVAPLLPRLSGEPRDAALSLLAARPLGAVRLLEAARSGAIDLRLFTPDLIERLKLHADTRVQELLASLKPPGAPTTEAMRARIEHLKDVLRSGAANPYAGRKLFEASCAKCHVLFGKGGRIGPDLTPYKRDDLETLLLHIVNPNAEVREGFETYLVATEDGRILDGFLADQDAKVVVLRGSDGQNITIERSKIRVMKVTGRSLMPEGLLDALSESQVRDLFGYLRSSQPLSD